MLGGASCGADQDAVKRLWRWLIPSPPSPCWRCSLRISREPRDFRRRSVGRAGACPSRSPRLEGAPSASKSIEARVRRREFRVCAIRVLRMAAPVLEAELGAAIVSAAWRAGCRHTGQSARPARSSGGDSSHLPGRPGSDGHGVGVTRRLWGPRGRSSRSQAEPRQARGPPSPDDRPSHGPSTGSWL